MKKQEVFFWVCVVIAFALMFSSCASGVIYTGKKGRWVGGNYSHFQQRAAIKAEKKALKELYGKQ